VLPAIIGVILGPRAELQLRRALQISNGEVSGLFTSGVAIGIYTIIAIILVWPLINRFVVRRFRKPAHEVHHGHAHVLVELAEELAADSEHLSEDESVLARAEREAHHGHQHDDRDRDDRDDRDGPAGRRTAGAVEARSPASDTPPRDIRRE
jgi:putative tricarboxylic transport membrane protein